MTRMLVEVTSARVHARGGEKGRGGGGGGGGGGGAIKLAHESVLFPTETAAEWSIG